MIGAQQDIALHRGNFILFGGFLYQTSDESSSSDNCISSVSSLCNEERSVTLAIPKTTILVPRLGFDILIRSFVDDRRS